MGFKKLFQEGPRLLFKVWLFGGKGIAKALIWVLLKFLEKT
jgi:hypothetical protein